MLAILGIATIGTFLVLVVATRTPVIAALILTPLAAAVAGGFGHQVGAFAIDGLKTVAPVAALMLFAVLYFGLMIDVGLFDPLVERLLGLVRGDAVRLCLATAALPMLVALDGDGATTFLISITALLPVHRRMGIDPRVLPAIVALAAGVMNLLPWGGPTARAMSVLRAGVDQIFVPVLPAMGVGILWVFFVAWWLGRAERRRLASQPGRGPEARSNTIVTERPASPATGSLFYFNAALTVVVVLLLLQGLAADWLRLPELPAPLLFMIAFAIALPINRRTAAAQREQLASHAAKCRAGRVDDSRGWRLYRNPERQRNDQSDGHGPRVEYPAGAFALAQSDRRDDQHAAEPGVHTGRVLLRRSAGLRRGGRRGRPRSAGDRPRGHPWPDDDRFSPESDDRVDLHPARPVRRVAARSPEVYLRVGVRDDPGHDTGRLNHGGPLIHAHLAFPQMGNTVLLNTVTCA